MRMVFVFLIICAMDVLSQLTEYSFTEYQSSAFSIILSVAAALDVFSIYSGRGEQQ